LGVILGSGSGGGHCVIKEWENTST
jgi:hypothetical protein